MAPPDTPERLATLEERVRGLAVRVDSVERGRARDLERLGKLERTDRDAQARAAALAEVTATRDRRDGRRLVVVGLALTFGGLLAQVVVGLAFRGGL